METAQLNQTGDQQIIRWLGQARGGSNEALGHALDAYRKHLAATAKRLLPTDLRPKGGVSDMVQESLLDAYRNFDSFRGASPVELLGWLNKIMRNRLAKFTRTYRTRKRSSNREQSLDHMQNAEAAIGIVPPQDESDTQQQRTTEMARAVERLPEYYREVIELRHRFQLQFGEISLLMGKSEVAVRRAWARGLDRLRQDIERSEAAAEGRDMIA